MPSIEVAVLVVAYNGRELLPGCLDALLASEDVGVVKHIVVVDNKSTDDTPAIVRQRYPQVEVIEASENLGFAGGNNLGWEHIQRTHPATCYLALVNQDVTVESGWFSRLVETLDGDSTLASVQPKILLDPARNRINTLGTRSHFLGFGFPIAFGELDDACHDRPIRVDSASGAACLIRADTVGRFGLFDARLFMYLEDVELGWRLRQLGYDHQLVPAARAYHRYSFRRDVPFYYYLERNRWWLLGVYLKGATLALLLPALLFMECGQLVFAILRGRLIDKLSCYGFFLKLSTWRGLLIRRREIQSRRKLTDREFMARFTGCIESPELRGWLVRWVADPCLSSYWAVVRMVIAW